MSEQSPARNAIGHAEEQVNNYCKSLIDMNALPVLRLLIDNERTTIIMAMLCHGREVGIWQVRKNSSIPKRVRYADFNAFTL